MCDVCSQQAGAIDWQRDRSAQWGPEALPVRRMFGCMCAFCGHAMKQEHLACIYVCQCECVQAYMCWQCTRTGCAHGAQLDPKSDPQPCRLLATQVASCIARELSSERLALVHVPRARGFFISRMQLQLGMHAPPAMWSCQVALPQARHPSLAGSYMESALAGHQA